MKTVSSLGEFGVINLIYKIVGISRGALKGIGDDAAVLPWTMTKVLLFATDMITEDVHFTRHMPAEGIGHKVLACNISDIAAMGGIPKYAVCSLGVPPATSELFLKKFLNGFQRLAKKFNVELVGGDLVKSDKITANVAILGEALKQKVVYRSGARIGDKIFVTGPLGRSLQSGHHLKFMPRVKEAQYLIRHVQPHAMMDISDGLAGDLRHILTQSKVGACLAEDQIPRRNGATIQQALSDGEDFELLFTVSVKDAKKLRRSRTMKFYEIGDVIPLREGFVVKDGRGRIVPAAGSGYRHF